MFTPPPLRSTASQHVSAALQHNEQEEGSFRAEARTGECPPRPFTALDTPSDSGIASAGKEGFHVRLRSHCIRL